MRRLALGLVICTALMSRGPSVRAQDPPAFRTGAILIEVSVAALDGEGNPVTDLKRDEFTLLERDRPRDVAFFRFDGALSQRSERAALPLGRYSNRPEYTAAAPRGVTVIVLDSINSRVSGNESFLVDQVQARSQLLRYLTSIEPGTRVALYQFGWRLRVLHDFTEDVESLKTKIASLIADAAAYAAMPTGQQLANEGITVVGPAPLAIAEMRRVEGTYAETLEDRKRAVTLASLEAIGDHLAGVSARKNLVWMTLGMPIITKYRDRSLNHEPQMRATAQRLASQGIAIYPVDIQGLKGAHIAVSPRPTGLPGNTREWLPNPNRAVDQGLWASMSVMAEVTGGRFSRNTNDMAEGLKATEKDLRGSYTLGFYTEDEPDDSWRPLDVKVLRQGVRLSHRRGYLLSIPRMQPRDWSAEYWQAALMQPLGSTAVRLDARLERAAGDDTGTHALNLEIAREDLQFRKQGDGYTANVEIAVAEKVRSGGFAYRREALTFTIPASAPTSDMVMRYAVALKPREDTISVRVVVRDQNTGRVGILDIPVSR